MNRADDRRNGAFAACLLLLVLTGCSGSSPREAVGTGCPLVVELDPNISANDGGTLLVTVRNQSSSPIEFYDLGDTFFPSIFLGDHSGFNSYGDVNYYYYHGAYVMNTRLLPPRETHTYRISLKKILLDKTNIGNLHRKFGNQILAFVAFDFNPPEGGSSQVVFSPIVELRNIPKPPALPPDPSSTADPGQAVPLDDNRRIEKTLPMPTKS